MDDRRVGAALRALRRRRKLRQQDVATGADVSDSAVSRAEAGHLETLSLRTIRAIFAAVDATVVVEPRWRGGALDRVLDERHAALVGRVAAILQEAGWLTEIEVTFSRYGERGSIDILAAQPATRALLVCEIKIDLTSVEETVRKSDVKTRLAPLIGHERFGWRPLVVGRLLVLPAGTTARRRVTRHAAVFDAAFPHRSAEIRRWLRRPDRRLSGLWFLPDSRPRGIGSERAGPGPPRGRPTRPRRA